jgi:hypothetical protein
MKNDRKIIVSTAAVLAATALTLARPALAFDAVDWETLRMRSEFEIGSGEQFMLRYGKHPRTYRICVKDMPGDVPLKLAVDGRTVQVPDGTCDDVTGAHIMVGPVDALKGDAMLFGKFEPLKK